MGEFLASLVSITFLAQVLRITMPYALTAMGGAISERSGVVNIALEGILLMGAFGAAAGAYDSGGSMIVGLAYGMVAGVATAALYALAVVTFKADQIVSGVAINMLALALTPYLLKLFYNSASNSPKIDGMSGNIFANWIFWMAVLLVPAVHFLVNRTRWGLRVRAVGDHPEAAHTLGVSVNAIRWQAVLGSGALAGLGGAWLSLSGSGFVAGMSAGRGYIALAAVIMGSWRPLWACAACLLFGFAETIQLNLQSYDIGIPNEIVQTFPYVLTMITLAGFIGRSRAPAALGRPYESH
ncbi:MAG TPA: ABC transporter permease [Kofleriaceae bacterium]|nr:ABC transporter permease [Kofleriaceae bacterium]